MSNTRKTAASRKRRTTEARTPKPAAKKASEPARPMYFELDFDGAHYVIESEAANDLELYEAIEDEHYMTALRGFLGREQWSRFKESQRDPDTGRVPMTRLEDFLNACMEAIGLGNSSSSPGSSDTTAGNSKRTSSAGTESTSETSTDDD